MITLTLSQLGLHSQHVEKLTLSAIHADVAKSRGYKTVDTKKRLTDLGFSSSQAQVPGLLIPLWDPTGQPAGHQYRPDNPRTVDGRIVKYESVPKTSPVLDVPRIATDWVQQTCPLWITEGALKVDALASVGIAAISLAGVSAWVAEGRALGGWKDVRLRGREIVIAFDSDVMIKESVRSQLESLAFYLRGRGARVSQCILPAPGVGEKTGVDDYLFAGYSAADLKQLVTELPENVPQPLPTQRAAPPFPVAALPPLMAMMVIETAEATQTDFGMAATCALTAMAAAVGGRLDVEVYPGWIEPATLYTCTVLGPAERKSAVQNQVFRPLSDLEGILQEEEGPEIRERRMKFEIKKRRFEKAKEAAARVDRGGEEAAEADAQVAMEELATVQGHLREDVRLLAGDVTPEKLVGLLADQKGRMAVASTEGGLFATMGGRYGGVPNLDALLQAHAGDPIRVDRQTRESQRVEHPALTVGLMVQPQVLEVLMRDVEMRGRGLPARFLFSVPPSMVGRRRSHTAPVLDETAAAWARLLMRLGRWAYFADHAVIVRLSESAHRVQLEQQEAVEVRLGPDGDLRHIADWAGKLVGATARLAGLLHAALHPDNWAQTMIDEATYRAAVLIADYYTEHALAAFDLGGGTGRAVELLEHLRRKQLESFTERNLFTGLSRSRWPAMNVLQPALRVLEDYGWIARLPSGDSTGPGRPGSAPYLVHADTHRPPGDRLKVSGGDPSKATPVSADTPLASVADSADFAEPIGRALGPVDIGPESSADSAEPCRSRHMLHVDPLWEARLADDPGDPDDWTR